MRDTTRLERVTMAVKGDRAELRLEAGRITITKQSVTTGRPSSVTATADQIRGATVERPSRGQRGWFHLAVVGGSVLPPTELAASADPYTFPITGRDVSAAKRVARLVTDHVRRRGLPAESPAAQLETSSGVTIASGPAPTPRVAARDPAAVDTYLSELDDLHRAGVLTDDEYERARIRVADQAAADDHRRP